MRIAIDVTAVLPESTGVDVYMLRLVEHLARIDRENDYRVVVNYEGRHRYGWSATVLAADLALARRLLCRLGEIPRSSFLSPRCGPVPGPWASPPSGLAFGSL